MPYCLIGVIFVWVVLPLAVNIGLFCLYPYRRGQWATRLLGSTYEDFLWEKVVIKSVDFADKLRSSPLAYSLVRLFVLLGVLTVPIGYLELAVRWVVWRIRRSKAGSAPLAA